MQFCDWEVVKWIRMNIYCLYLYNVDLVADWDCTPHKKIVQKLATTRNLAAIFTEIAWQFEWNEKKKLKHFQLYEKSVKNFIFIDVMEFDLPHDWSVSLPCFLVLFWLFQRVAADWSSLVISPPKWELQFLLLKIFYLAYLQTCYLFFLSHVVLFEAVFFSSRVFLYKTACRFTLHTKVSRFSPWSARFDLIGKKDKMTCKARSSIDWTRTSYTKPFLIFTINKFKRFTPTTHLKHFYTTVHFVTHGFYLKTGSVFPRSLFYYFVLDVSWFESISSVDYSEENNAGLSLFKSINKISRYLYMIQLKSFTSPDAVCAVGGNFLVDVNSSRCFHFFLL